MKNGDGNKEKGKRIKEKNKAMNSGGSLNEPTILMSHKGIDLIFQRISFSVIFLLCLKSLLFKLDCRLFFI